MAILCTFGGLLLLCGAHTWWDDRRTRKAKEAAWEAAAAAGGAAAGSSGRGGDYDGNGNGNGHGGPAEGSGGSDYAKRATVTDGEDYAEYNQAQGLPNPYPAPVYDWTKPGGNDDDDEDTVPAHGYAAYEAGLWSTRDIVEDTEEESSIMAVDHARALARRPLSCPTGRRRSRAGRLWRV